MPKQPESEPTVPTSATAMTSAAPSTARGASDWLDKNWRGERWNRDEAVKAMEAYAAQQTATLRDEIAEHTRWVMKDAVRKHDMGLATHGDGIFYNKRAEAAEREVAALREQLAEAEQAADFNYEAAIEGYRREKKRAEQALEALRLADRYIQNGNLFIASETIKALLAQTKEKAPA